ncbi:hypothetical protein QX249_08805 [Vibrio parahaemolyticus]|uniref:Uncharacterized protein n=1 Tax=Vibrio parahaemolyticus TaxID=670 RepID=A0AAW8PX00_VIBPH|nr:hypothetical protein [Vibrio parahaemolyticus]EGR2229360.1 hypothetical protein [Vibrio parahaemolyticus]MDS1820757.1 hypothetical protein [Vibrio parahaemolyticus]
MKRVFDIQQNESKKIVSISASAADNGVISVDMHYKSDILHARMLNSSAIEITFAANPSRKLEARKFKLMQAEDFFETGKHTFVTALTCDFTQSKHYLFEVE